jgi:hypothetical protein
MNKRSISTYLELAVSHRLVRTKQEPLGIRNLLVIGKEMFMSTIGFVAATPVLFVAPFTFLMTLNPVSDQSVDGASKEP